MYSVGYLNVTKGFYFPHTESSKECHTPTKKVLKSIFAKIILHLMDN